MEVEVEKVAQLKAAGRTSSSSLQTIHHPPFLSSHSSDSRSAMSTDLSPHETVRKLMERKDDIEAEIVSSLPLGQLKLRRLRWADPPLLPGSLLFDSQEGHRGRLEAVGLRLTLSEAA